MLWGRALLLVVGDTAQLLEGDRVQLHSPLGAGSPGWQADKAWPRHRPEDTVRRQAVVRCRNRELPPLPARRAQAAGLCLVRRVVEGRPLEAAVVASFHHQVASRPFARPCLRRRCHGCCRPCTHLRQTSCPCTF